MIDYYLVDFWIGFSQAITMILLCISFFCYMLFEQHRKPLLVSAVVLTIVNFAILVVSVVWPYLLR
ncbi:MAG: hypothetical protein HWN65_12555 [Candidatus Helarchaeota archaeon]|nr:hypothetical protein [Candidatus Helarchaeota archaeon]